MKWQSLGKQLQHADPDGGLDDVMVRDYGFHFSRADCCTSCVSCLMAHVLLFIQSSVQSSAILFQSQVKMIWRLPLAIGAGPFLPVPAHAARRRDPPQVRCFRHMLSYQACSIDGLTALAALQLSFLLFSDT